MRFDGKGSKGRRFRAPQAGIIMAEQKPENQGRQPISPAKRRMLQQWYESASKASASGNWDYATENLTNCVVEDPANRMYVQSFLGNLQKKFNNDKKGSKLAGIKGAGTKGSLKKSVMQKDWKNVFRTGLKLLELNPWDTATLVDLAGACRAMDCEETEIAFLRGALEANVADPEINRHLGRALGKQAQFDQAIICWQRVLKAKPRDEEAMRAVGDLTVEKTIHKGGYEGAETSTDVMVDKETKADRMGMGVAKATPEQQLEKYLAKNPGEVSKYIELADLHIRAERFELAEQVLTKALEASGGDVNIRERMEDVQLRRQRQQIDLAEKRALAENTPEAKALVEQLRVELNNKELEVYRNRCERYPGHAGFKFELGVRLERAGKPAEAIKCFQEARNDPRRKGVALLRLGRCFHHIKQYELAMDSYESAIGEISDREPDLKKEAVYLAARLAYGLKDYDKANKHATVLAGLDFSYKDVADLLDKLRRIRDKG
jgi:tetratricopeptide (TPR) repeat protein